MQKNLLLVFVAIAMLLLFSGCTVPGMNGKIGFIPEDGKNLAQANHAPAQTNAAGSVSGNSTAPAADKNLGENTTGLGATTQNSGLELKEWKAPDGSITLQVPTGWPAAEKKVDNCTVSWSVTDPTSTKSAYMDNQIMVFKSEDAKGIYTAYGMQGIDNVPVSAYLLPEQAVSQIVAPLGGSSNVQILETDSAMSAQLSAAFCIQGLAACNSLVFDATYDNNGKAMKGKYFATTFDLGDGMTWWINQWGYTSPASEWEESKALLEQIFTSVKYTDAWSEDCQENAAATTGVINEVIKERQAASQDSAEQWDQYIRN